MKDQDLKKFLEDRKIPYHLDAPIKPYVTMGIGGTVPWIIVVSNESHLKELLAYLHQKQHRYVLLGGGSNVIFAGDSASLMVVINRTPGILKEQDHLLKVSSGVFINELMGWCISNNAGGMEFLAGIPGTLGGAAAVNAGAFGQSISSILEKAKIITPSNEIKTVDHDYFDFSYRHSRFKHNNEIILEVFLKFTDVPGDQVKEKVNANTRYRKDNHPYSIHGSAGCFFKNPEIDGKKIPAGRLIEQSGFKGTFFKTLQVSGAHANFIINRGEASFADICELEANILKKVFIDRGIKLEREVIYISPEGKKY